MWLNLIVPRRAIPMMGMSSWLSNLATQMSKSQVFPCPVPPPSSSSTFLNSHGTSTRHSLSTFHHFNPTNQLDQIGAATPSLFSPLRHCSNDEAEVDDGVSMKKTAYESFEANKDVSSIKILSYNVWFREDLEMQERMEEIGDLIHLHSPHIICLQEVTPDSYDIFQNSSWWRLYQCSVSRKMAYSKAYFCMLLAKLPVKSFTHKPFSNIKMGRELCIAEIEVKPDKSLVVATSHLESPCPGPPKWDQMYSKERVAQAKESINHLKEHPNVVFGGDMNWDDKLDGQFPYPEGWVDAWLNLRPKEEGYTYDTKSNKMLSGNRTLRKRLDRFICNLQDFKISGIEMVGTEEILGLSYHKEKTTKNGVEKLMLPVFPSDHFGLLLTITKL